MMDDLDWILDTYGSVPEYYRSRSEETYEDHIRSEKLRNMEEAIGKADNTRRHWVRVPVWEGNDYTGCRLMTGLDQRVRASADRGGNHDGAVLFEGLADDIDDPKHRFGRGYRRASELEYLHVRSIS